MRTFTKEELAEILEEHKKWLNGEDGGECADIAIDAEAILNEMEG